MKRLLVLGAGLGLLSAAHVVRSALRALDGALRGVGRVPLMKQDGLLGRIPAKPKGSLGLLAAGTFGGPGLSGIPINVSESVPPGKFILLDGGGRVVMHPYDAYGRCVPWVFEL